MLHFKGFRAVNVICKRAQSFSNGEVASISRKLTVKDVEEFARISGDTNPIHFANDNAIVHGALLNSIISGLIGTKLPGPGTLVVSQNLHFPNKCYVDETVSFKVELVEHRKIIKVKFVCEVQNKNKIVLYGDAKLVMKM